MLFFVVPVRCSTRDLVMPEALQSRAFSLFLKTLFNAHFLSWRPFYPVFFLNYAFGLLLQRKTQLHAYYVSDLKICIDLRK